MSSLVLATALVAATAVCLARLLRLRGLVAFVLGSGTIAFAEVVVVSHALSPFDAYERGWLLAALAALASAAVVAVKAVRPPAAPKPSLAAARELLADRHVAILAVVVTVELAYLTALSTLTPPVEFDVVTYHLARAAFWVQRGSVGFVGEATYEQIDEFPPNAEILQSATMLLSGSVRWVGLVQLAALAVCTLAIYGIATRLGLRRTHAAFGALLFPTLPVVALQAPTALNDLVVAAAVATAVFFALGSSRGDFAMAGTCAGLLVGTKVTAALALPVLLAVAVLAQRGRRRIELLGAGLAGVTLGATWYAAAALRDDDGFGSAGHSIGAPGGVVGVLARTTRYLVEAVELPGAAGRDAYLYVAAGTLAAVACGVAGRWRTGVVAGAVTAAAALIPGLEDVLHRGYFRGWQLLGHDRALDWGIVRESTLAASLQSWYGPVGAGLSLVAIVVLARRLRTRRGPLLLLLAGAPLVVIVGSATVTDYHPFSGRFAMGAVALAAATWGVVRSYAPLATAAVAVAGVTVLLSVVNSAGRPAGVDLLEGTDRPSIWELPRAWAQAVQPEVSRVIAYVDRNAPESTVIGITRDELVYPFAYVGYPDIEHPIVYADTLDEATRAGAQWAVLPERSRLVGRWALAFRSTPWAVFRRAA